MNTRAAIAGWCLIAVAAAAGCRIPGYDGPVSQAVATSRQYARRGVAAMERGQNQEAEQWLAKAVKVCPADPEARRNYAESLWQRNARPEAIAQLQEAARRAEDDAALQVRLAEMHLEMGRLDAAQKSAEKAIDLDPRLPQAWATRGRVLRAAGRLREALADGHRALGYNPEDQAVLLEVAELYRQLNEPQRALQSLQNLAETYPPDEEPQQVLYLTGLAQMALLRYDDAVDSLAAAAARETPDAEVFYRLAEAEMQSGNIDGAFASAVQALRLMPDHQPSQDLLGQIQTARAAHAATLR
jgi:tetratricopeptide (TPR) repeat protein